MIVFDRFKLELNNQNYFSDREYKQFLIEQDLDYSAEYVKSDMQKQLLLAVIDVLEAVANDINMMRSISTSFANIGQAYEFIENRIINLKDKIAAIPENDDTEVSCFSMMFSRNKGHQVEYTGNMQAITNEQIDNWFAEREGK